jgi:hypothetical protein
MITRGVLTAALITGVVLTTATPAGAREGERPTIETVASGLDNPRGLAFGPDGALYVAEAGRGAAETGWGAAGTGSGAAATGQGGAGTGSGAAETGRGGAGTGSGAAGTDWGAAAPCRPGPTGALLCRGRTGAITMIRDGSQRRVVRNLPSMALPSGNAAVGPDAVSVGADGLVSVGETVVRPYRRKDLVKLDRTAGALLRVGPKGRALTLARVPAATSATAGPGEVIFVGDRSRVWRVEPGQPLRKQAEGFAGVVGLAWSDGVLYVLEASGTLLRVTERSRGRTTEGSRGRTTEGSRGRVVAGLTAPGGLVVSGRHAFVTTCSVCRGSGEVLRIDLADGR